VNALPFTNKFSNTFQKLWVSFFYIILMGKRFWSSTLLTINIVFTVAIILCRKLMKLVGNCCSHTTRSKWRIVTTYCWMKNLPNLFFWVFSLMYRNMCFRLFLKEQASKEQSMKEMAEQYFNQWHLWGVITLTRTTANVIVLDFSYLKTII
jgi:hypothetical protein